MLTDWIAAARTRAAKRAPSGRGFFLESDPLPKVLPGQGLGDGDDEVQELVAEGPGDDGASWVPLSLREARRRAARCQVLPVLETPSDLTPEEEARLRRRWEEAVADGRGRDALVPEPVTVALDNRTAVFTPVYAPGALRGPTPIADDLRRDWELLEWANGRLVARVRTLESQLRAAGIEPAPRSGT